MEAVGRIQKGFGDYTPSAFPAQLLTDPSITDQTAYQMAKFWRDVTTNNYRAAEKGVPKNESPDEKLHMKFEFTSDGYRIINTRTGGIETVYSIGSGGGFGYDGRVKDVLLIGGRSELGGIPQATQQIHEKLRDHDMRH